MQRNGGEFVKTASTSVGYPEYGSWMLKVKQAGMYEHFKKSFSNPGSE